MKKLILLIQNIRDQVLLRKCHRSCLCCRKYKTYKEMDSKCEARKARGRIIDREQRECYRKRKLEGD